MTARATGAMPRHARPAVLLIGPALFVLSACAGKAPPVPRPPLPPPAARPGLVEKGVASWYGPAFHGRTTASGERYNMLDLTAAHRTFPFDTYVRVTNLLNGRRLVVRINDRGPFRRGRIIDLSYTAAKVLGIPENGTARVRLEVIDPERGALVLKRQQELVRRGGVRTWTDREFAAIAAAEKGG